MSPASGPPPPPGPGAFPPGRPRAALLLFAALYLAQAAHGLASHSGTCDELGAHVPAGILYWKSGEFSGGAANPPLGQLLAAAGPVVTGGADSPLADDPRAMLPARIPSVLLGLVTVLVAGRLGLHAGGRVAAAAAAGTAALSPNLVAHAGLATLDGPSTAFLALAGLLAWEHARTGRRPPLLGFAAAIGAAVAVKTSALHGLPAIALGAFLLEGPRSARIPRALRLLTAGVVGIVVVAWATYGPGDSAGPLPRAFVDAFLTKWEHGRSGHFSYLLGERSGHGFPHYFAVALAVKTPLVTLVAAAAGLVAVLRRRVSGDGTGLTAFVLLPAAWIFLAVSFVHRVDIGVRHVLPVLPALHALAGVGFAALLGGPRPARLVAAALAIGLLGTAATTTPDHLGYFQRLAGGPDRGDRILIDSNLDWGQDEARLRRWAEGRDVAVNPARPVEGLVAANVNAIRGILSVDDSRLGWIDLLEPEVRIGTSWRVVRADADAMRRAGDGNPARALRAAEWFAGTGRGEEALAVLRRPESPGADDPARRQRALARASLAAGDLATARAAAAKGADPDLAAIVAYRTAAAEGLPWTEAAGDRWIRLLPALVRDGRREESDRVCREATGLSLEALARRGHEAAPRETRWGEAARRLEIARRLRAFGLEREALAEAGAALAADPTLSEALWIYGELVVRRKLGLAEYPWPEVDWSGVAREPR